MVFESLVVSLLNNYLGKYIKDLDSSNLNLGIWNGDAVLTELTLKDDALADLDLPIEVQSGYIGKLSLSIPWTNLYTKPVVVKIEDVFVVASPVTERDFDANEAEDRLRAAKRRKLQSIHKSNNHRNNNIPEESALPDDYTFLEKLTAQIIKNFQIFVKNIHVRYEDKVTSPGNPFAVGITLKHLTAETTDEFWKPCIVEATVKKVFKLVSLDSLSVYWNTNIKSVQRYGGSKSWKSLLRTTINSKNDEPNDYEYVLEPFSVEAHVKIDQTSAVNVDEPKVTIEVVQRDMILALSKTQFHNLMNLIESFELMLANEPYRKYRPSAPPRHNVKAWWNYAYTAIVEEKVRTWSWTNIKRHRALYHDYKNLYKKKLLCHDKGIENSELTSKVRDLEDQLDLSSILIAREHAQAEFKINPGVLDEPVETSSGWWSWMFGENTINKKETEEDFDLSTSLSLSALSPTEKQRLYDALDYSESNVETNYPKEYVKYKLMFSMDNFEVHLLNEKRRNLALVSMTGVSGSLQHRPSSSNTSIFLEVNDLNVYGHSANLNEPQPHLIALQKSDEGIDLVLLDFTFEIEPIHVPADYAVYLKLKPVQIVHDTNTVMQIVNFFKMPQSRALQELTEAASSGLQEFQSRTRAGLEFAASRQTIVYFDVNLRSPCVVVPEYGAMQRPGTVFVVDFGHLTVETNLNSRHTVIQDATESELENMLCDHFDVTLSEMQILISDKGVDWQSAHAQSTSPYHLLPASQIGLEIQRNTNTTYSSLPEIILKGVLPSLDIMLSDEKYQQLMQFISNIPLLTESSEEYQQDGRYLKTYPQTLSRHPSRLSLDEVASIQIACREALSAENVPREDDVFVDAEEELPDTDDEEEWFLASDKLPGDTNSSDSSSVSPPSTSGNTTRNDQVTLSGNFSIKKVSVVFNKIVESVDQPYIKLVVSELGAQVSVLECEMRLGAKLGSVHLIDFLFKDIDGNSLTVLSSVAEKDLISFSYRKIYVESPDPGRSLEGPQYLFKTEFNTLNVLLHHEGIITFQNFVMDLIERSEKPNLRKLGQRVSSYLEVIPEEEPEEIADFNKKEEETPVQDSGKTKAEATLGEVLMTLSANDRHFALLKINGLRVDAFLEGRETRIKTSLEHFDIEDLEEDTLYDKILTVEDENLCDVEIMLYSNDKDVQSDPLKVNMDILFNFGRLKLVLLHNFVSSLMDFFASFTSAETKQLAQEATSQAVQIQVENLRETSPKIGLKVDINAPVIKVPIDCQSKDGVIIDLGRLQVNNGLKYLNTRIGHVLTDVMNIRLDSFQVARSDTSASWVGTHNLIDPTGLDITFTRCLDESYETVPTYDVQAKLGQLTASADEKDFEILMKTWAENVQLALMSQDGETMPPGDDISHMPEVEQHEVEKNDRNRAKKTSYTNDKDVILRLDVSIDYVSLKSPISIDNERIPYLEANVYKLKAVMVVSNSTTEVSARLGDLFVFDHRNKGGLLKPLPVLESSRDKDLISVQYNKSSSESQPSNATQTLEILSTVIKLHLAEESVLGIQKLALSFLESSGLSGGELSLDNIDETKASEPKAKESEPEDDQIKKTGDFKLTVNLRKVDLTLSRKNIKIVRAVIEDVFTEIMTAGDKFVIYSRQTGLSVTDLNPLSNYPEVVAIEGNKLFDFEYQSLPNLPTPLSDNDNKPTPLTTPHSLLSLYIGKIHLVFLYKLMADIRAFVQALMNPDTTSYGYDLAQKTVQDQLQSIEEQGTRIRLKVNIEAPIVLFPSHSQSINCLVADLGQLHAENTFTTRSSERDVTQIVVIDKIDVALQSVQLSRGILDRSTSGMARRLLIQPVRMSMVVSRCMQTNAHWLPYLNIEMKFDHIEMKMDEADYRLLISAMQENYAEAGASVVDGAIETSVVDEVNIPNNLSSDERDGSVERDDVEELVEKPWDEIRIDFSFSGLSLALYNDKDVKKHSSYSLQPHNAQASLCTCELQESYGSLVTHSDSSVDVHLFLYDCIVEDARPSKMTAFPRVLSHSTEQEHGRKRRHSKHGSVERPNMIEVLYKQTPSGEMKVNVILQDPTLYISFPLIWSLLDFFTVSRDEATAFSQSDPPIAQSTRLEAATSATVSYILEVKGTLKNPEIVLLGEPENPNSSALIVQTTTDFVYNLVDERQNFRTSSKELVVHTCRYPERDKTLYKVLKPCEIDFQYSYPGRKCEGQEIDLSVPQMKVKVSPLLLKTLLAIYYSFYGAQETTEDNTPEQLSKVEEGEDFWRPHPISKDDWYRKTSQARVPSRIHLNTTVNEKFSMKIKSARVKLYNEVMAHRVPLLLVNSNIDSEVWNWSSKVKLETDMSVEAWYHNEKLAAWEPLIESEETSRGRHPWQLQLKIIQSDSHLLSFLPKCQDQHFSDEEDFINLTSSPVFVNRRLEFANYQTANSLRLSSPNYTVQRHHLENLAEVQPVSLDMSLEGLRSIPKDTKAVEIDEVDAFSPSPPSPVSSDSKIDQLDEIPRATYIVLNSYDIMQLTVTRSAVDVISDVIKVLSDITTPSSVEADLTESPFVILNELGIHASVTVSHRHEITQEPTSDLTISKRRRIDLNDVIDSGPGPSKPRILSLESLDLRRKDTGSLVKFKEDDSLRYTSVHKVRPLDYDNDVHKAYTEKRLVRSHSMPDRDMQNIIALAEERECYSKTVAAGVKESGEEAETETDPRSLEEKFGHNGLDGSHHVKEGAKRRKHCKSGAQIVLGSIEEETDEIQKDENKPKEVEDCGRRKDTKLEETKEMENEKAAPSAISGAFAAMGLMAGVSGHPVTGHTLVESAAENGELLFERPEYKKADDYISIQIDGFDELSFVLVSHAGRFLYQLSPKKNGRFYYIVVQIQIQHGQKRITIRAPLQVKNNLDIEIDLVEPEARSVSSSNYAAPKFRKINTVQPKGIVNVPLFSAHKGNLFIQSTSAGFKRSKVSISWKDFSENNDSTIMTCLPEEDGPKHKLCVKVLCEKDSLNTSPSKMAPHHILQLHPAMSFWNFIPFTINLKLEEANVSEIIIQPGKRCDITCVTTNKTSVFSLTVPQYMGTLWSGSFKLGGDVPRDNEVEMKPQRAVYNKLLIKLDYLDRGYLVANIYSPYWIVNKTNLTIRCKSTKSSGETYKQLASNPEPLLFDSPSKKRKIMLKLQGCEWSKSFSLDAIGNAGHLAFKEIKTSREYEMSFSIALSHNGLTKIITLVPKFVIINKTEYELSILEIEQKDNLWILVKANQCIPFWPRTKSSAFLVRLNNSILTSKVIRIDSLHPAVFRVGDSKLLIMNSEISESTTTIIFSPSSSANLPKVENLCEDISIRVQQKNAGSTTVVAPLTSIAYIWDEPGGNLQLLWQSMDANMQPAEIPIYEDGFGKVELNLKPNKRSMAYKKVKKTSSLMASCGCVGQRFAESAMRMEGNEPCDENVPNVRKTIYWVSFLNGFRRVLVFTDDPLCAKEARKHCEGEAVAYELFISLDGIRLSAVNSEPSEIIYLGISSATSIWEVEKSPGKWKILNVETSSLLEEAWRNDVNEHFFEKDVEVDFQSMKMTKPYLGALKRRYEPGLWVHYCSSITYESFSAKVNRVQVDNQIFGTVFPSALYPSPLPVYLSQRYGFKPFFEVSAIYHSDTRNNLLHFRYFKVLIQEMNVKLEKDFILAIYKLLYGDSSDDLDEEMLFQEDLRNVSLTLENIQNESGSFDTRRLYLEYFHLSPIKINLSISLHSNPYLSDKSSNLESDVVQFLVNSLGAPLTEVSDVEIKLACFERSGLFVTQGSLVSCARKHYTWQAVRQFHAIVLGLDVLGNPYGLYTDLKEGFKDLFYEPYQGIILGPQEFASGIVRGVKSLLGHAIGGTAEAMSKITGTFGQALVSLSFDPNYKMKRRLRMGKGPTGIKDGITMGGKSLILGLVFGVSGVVTKPIQGVRADGIEGFFKGFGKGILGLVTRPTVGVMDMVSTTLDGIRRSAEQDGEDIVVRMRTPRFCPPDAPLQPYNGYQADGNGILKSLPRKSGVTSDIYVDHIPLPHDGGISVALFTNVRVMIVCQNRFWSEWKISLNVPYEDIAGNTRLIQGGIEILKKDNVSNLIESTDRATLQTIQQKLEDQLHHCRATK